MDNDYKEINSLQELYPDAAVVLCKFHCMKAVDSRLVLPKLVIDRREEIYKMFQSAVNTLNEQTFNKLEMKLSSLGEFT